MKVRTHQLVGGLFALALAASTATGALAQEIKIGVLATLEGPFAAGGQDGMRGAEMAVKAHKGMIAGKKITLIKASSDASPDKAVAATRKLVECQEISCSKR